MDKESKLTLSEYRAIVESSPNMIWRAGTDGKCNYFNTTWLKFTVRTFEQENGDGWAEGVHKDDLEFCFSTYIKNFNTSSISKFQFFPIYYIVTIIIFPSKKRPSNRSVS